MNVSEHTKATNNPAVNVNEWITLAEACKLMAAGKGIKPKSMRNKIYRGELPDGCVKKSTRGNYFFHKATLMGLA